jgi:hypothetical protein
VLLHVPARALVRFHAVEVESGLVDVPDSIPFQVTLVRGGIRMLINPVLKFIDDKAS